MQFMRCTYLYKKLVGTTGHFRKMIIQLDIFFSEINSIGGQFPLYNIFSDISCGLSSLSSDTINLWVEM